MATNIRPLHDQVILKRVEEEGEQVRGGIIIPDTAKEKSKVGQVIAVGEGKYRNDGTRQLLDVKVGDHVLFSDDWDSTKKVNVDGEELLIIREEKILAVIVRTGAQAGGGKKGSK